MKAYRSSALIATDSGSRSCEKVLITPWLWSPRNTYRTPLRTSSAILMHTNILISLVCVYYHNLKEYRKQVNIIQLFIQNVNTVNNLPQLPSTSINIDYYQRESIFENIGIPQLRTNYLFSSKRRTEYLFPESARPPSELNGCPLIF